MNYSEFIKKSEHENVITATGDEFFVPSVISHLSSILGTGEFDITRFDDENFETNALISACEQLSFFSPHRLVVVKGVQSFTQEQKNKVLDYVKNINPACTLIFINCALPPVGEKLELSLSRAEIFEFVKSRLQEYNKTIDPNALSRLIEYSGSMNKLDSEIKKLAQFVGDGKNITLEDIDRVVPKDEEVVAFELTQALSEKNAQKSLEILSKLLLYDGQDTRILSLVSNNFRRMFFVSVSKEKTDSYLAAIFGVKEYAVKKLRATCRNFTQKTLKNILYKLTEVEFSLKSGKMASTNCLYFLCFYILCQ